MIRSRGPFQPNDSISPTSKFSSFFLKATAMLLVCMKVVSGINHLKNTLNSLPLTQVIIRQTSLQSLAHLAWCFFSSHQKTFGLYLINTPLPSHVQHYSLSHPHFFFFFFKWASKPLPENKFWIQPYNPLIPGKNSLNQLSGQQDYISLSLVKYAKDCIVVS